MSWMCPWQGCLLLPCLSRVHPAGALLRCPQLGSSSLGNQNMWYAVVTCTNTNWVCTVDVAVNNVYVIPQRYLC